MQRLIGKVYNELYEDSVGEPFLIVLVGWKKSTGQGFGITKESGSTIAELALVGGR